MQQHKESIRTVLNKSAIKESASDSHQKEVVGMSQMRAQTCREDEHVQNECTKQNCYRFLMNRMFKPLQIKVGETDFGTFCPLFKLVDRYTVMDKIIDTKLMLGCSCLYLVNQRRQPGALKGKYVH